MADWSQLIATAAAAASGMSFALAGAWYAFGPRLIDTIQRTVDPLTVEVHDLAREQVTHQVEMAKFVARTAVFLDELERRVTRNEERIERLMREP